MTVKSTKTMFAESIEKFRSTLDRSLMTNDETITIDCVTAEWIENIVKEWVTLTDFENWE
jgi:hypothetical protein